MRFVRFLGVLFVAAGVAALVRDVANAGGPAGFRLSALGEVWFALAPMSLDLARAVTERYIWPPLWDPVAVTVLLQPAAVVLGGLGVLLLALGALRRR